MDQVIRDILDGDKDRFRIIVRTYSEDLLRLAYHFAGNWEDAKDITQTTFIRVYRSLKRYDLSKPFKPWIYRIHLNNCRTAGGRQTKRRARFVPLEPESAATEPNPAASGDEDKILRCIHSLSLKQKAAFILIEIEGHDSEEASQIMGCSASTARVHLARAKRNLRRELTSIGFHDESA